MTHSPKADKHQVQATDLMVGDHVLGDDGTVVAVITGIPKVDGFTVLVEAQLRNGRLPVVVAFAYHGGKPELVWVLDTPTEQATPEQPASMTWKEVNEREG
jgi:hypothetical protein